MSSILMLFDLAESPPIDQGLESYADDLKSPDWETEAGVLAALTRLGHEVRLCGIHDELAPLTRALEEFRPELVFNLCEAFRGLRALESNVAAYLELVGSRATGASSRVLALCKDKALAKLCVAEACNDRGIKVPRSVTIRRGEAISAEELAFPVFVKPLGLESSMGISRESFVDNAKDLAARVRFVHERLGQDALVEEYVAGRELYVSVACRPHGRGTRFECFAPRELSFGNLSEGQPRFATYKAKWDDAYRAKWGIRSRFLRKPEAALEARLAEAGRTIASALGLDGYARLDLRLSDKDELMFLEANPNPSLAPDEDFAQAAQGAGLGYDALIEKLIKISANESSGRRRSDRATTSAKARVDCPTPGL